jgi:hypothetical protein
MPSDDLLLQQAEQFRIDGNASFGKGNLTDAVSAYSQGVVACDRLAKPALGSALKATLLGNRAMCELKQMDLTPTVEDCTSALHLLSQQTTMHTDASTSLRSKLHYRRAKAQFLLSGISKPVDRNLAEEAAKDLLRVLQIDPKNVEANQLLVTVRSQHKSMQTSSTPVSKAVQALKDKNDVTHHLKLLLNLLNEDVANVSMELGRVGGVSALLEVAVSTGEDVDANQIALSLQTLSQAGSFPSFCRLYLTDRQRALMDIVRTAPDATAIVSALAIYVRILLHADRDDVSKEITGKTDIEYETLLKTVSLALDWACGEEHNTIVIRAVLDLLSTWTAGTDRDSFIRTSLLGSSVTDPSLPVPKTQTEIRAMTPHQLADHRKREYDKKLRDTAWAFERGILFCQEMKTFLVTAISCHDHVVRREMTVVLGRLLAHIEEDDRIKSVVIPYLSDPRKTKHTGVTIEEVCDEDNELKKEENFPTNLELKMERALITASLLLSKKDVGAWSLLSGWHNAADEILDLIQSRDDRAMCLASEVVSSAATVENARHLVSNLLTSGSLKTLLLSHDRDIRSGATSAIAKLGLSDKSTDEGEIMGLLEAACELLEDEANETEIARENKCRGFKSFAFTSVERAIEMITYLVVNTSVKEELAAGFRSRNAPHTALERLVNTADLPNAGDSLSAFGLATIFQHMAATNEQIRKEAFEGKEVTMEQYDEMQLMGKTQEEKEVIESQKDTDTQNACQERIRKMANANVPRAIVTLMEGSSEHTLEQSVICLTRMAVEQSIRGFLVQQGALSACIKVEKKEGPTETCVMKKVIRLARHCIAKILISTNPALLTSAQRLGSIRPLIQLIRDNKGTELQHFEALMAVTNLSSAGEDAQSRIVTEKGISSFHFCMFSENVLVRRAATEAMCNLVQNKAMLNFLTESEHLKLWLAFASDYEEENYEGARAASGCLAMATQDELVAIKLIELPKFKDDVVSLLESGRLELMHRALVIVSNLLAHGGQCGKKVVAEGLVEFCRAYVHAVGKTEGLDFLLEEQALLPVTVDLSKRIVEQASTTS